MSVFKSKAPAIIEVFFRDFWARIQTLRWWAWCLILLAFMASFAFQYFFINMHVCPRLSAMVLEYGAKTSNESLKIAQKGLAFCSYPIIARALEYGAGYMFTLIMVFAYQDKVKNLWKKHIQPQIWIALLSIILSFPLGNMLKPYLREEILYGQDLSLFAEEAIGIDMLSYISGFMLASLILNITKQHWKKKP